MDGKFAMIPLEMFGDESLRPLDIVVYSALDTFVNAFGEAWPSLSRLAERAGVSLATTKRALQRLEKAGYVTRQQRRVPGSREFDRTLYSLPFRIEGYGEDGAEVGSGDVGPEDADVGSASDRSAPTDCEVGSERAGNYTQRTIPKRQEHYDTRKKDKEDERETESRPNEIDSPMLQEAFTELWERSPCKQYRGEARKAFLALFPVGISQRETERRLRTVRRRFDIFEKEAEKLVGKGEESRRPCLRDWLVSEGFYDPG